MGITVDGTEEFPPRQAKQRHQQQPKQQQQNKGLHSHTKFTGMM